jgi:thymidylate synthase (FAD)
LSSVKLIAITNPVIEGITSPEEFIAYAARVSNPSNQMNTETSAKLLKYLIKNKHWSPFEMVSVCMEIKTTRDIGRQILRHRSFSFQEFSQRYADPNQLGFSYKEARLQDLKNRQNSIVTNDNELAQLWDEVQTDVLIAAKKAYTFAINNGIAKEQARAVLPEGMTNSTMYMSGTLRSWIHYCDLRKSNGTQLEHQRVTLDAIAELKKYFPIIMSIMDDYTD